MVLYRIYLSWVAHVTLPLPLGTSPPTLRHPRSFGRAQTVSFLTVDPLLPKWHHILRIPVIRLRNALIDLLMDYPGPEGVVILWNWRVYSSVTSDTLRSFVHIDPLVVSSISSNTVGSKGRTFYSFLDVLLTGYHDVLLLGVTVSMGPLGRTAFLGRITVRSVLSILPL